MSEPRIVIYDIETIPDLNEALKVWPGLSNFPGRTLSASINSVCCFGYKILGSGCPAQVISAWDFPEWSNDVNDDRPLLSSALEILNSADGVITQNGKKFDERFLQTRLLLRKMDLIPPVIHSDTKQIAKRFSFFSNSLKYLAEQLTDKRKLDNDGWELWVKVHGGIPRVRDIESEKAMAIYCAGDVEALEAVYNVLRPMARGANAPPNQNLFLQGIALKVCPSCGSSRLRFKGYRYNKTNTRKKYSCLDCGNFCSTDAEDRLPRSL